MNGDPFDGPAAMVLRELKAHAPEGTVFTLVARVAQSEKVYVLTTDKNPKAALFAAARTLGKRAGTRADTVTPRREVAGLTTEAPGKVVLAIGQDARMKDAKMLPIDYISAEQARAMQTNIDLNFGAPMEGGEMTQG